ncbi:MAG: hypothetical protein JJU33_10910 [Phycisphaerales bacterium]|nr:hypothetical protein [Phycisphaerales bacterium]
MRTRDRGLIALVGVLVSGGFSAVAAFANDGPVDLVSTVIAVMTGVATLVLGFIALAQAMGGEEDEA